jgi:hypothetical protein
VSDLTPPTLEEIRACLADPAVGFLRRDWAAWLLAALAAAETRADQLALECHKFAARTGEVEDKNVRLKEQLAELYDKSKERMERAEKERDEARRDFDEVQASLFLARNRRDVLENALTEIAGCQSHHARDVVAVARAALSWEQATCPYCGLLDWTVRRYGRVTHKEGCPARTDPWSQTYPQRETTA